MEINLVLALMHNLVNRVIKTTQKPYQLKQPKK